MNDITAWGGPPTPAPSPQTGGGGETLRLPDRIGVRLRRRLEPARPRHLLLRVEVDPLSPLNVQVAEERLVPAREREPRHWGGDADIDADHARVEAALELARRVAVPREDARPVAVVAFAAQSEGMVEIVGPHHRQDR